MGYQFELTDEKAQPVLSMRVRTAVSNLPQEFGRVYGEILKYLEETGETTDGPAFGAYYNLDMENLDVGIGFIMPKAIPGKGDIQAAASLRESRCPICTRGLTRIWSRFIMPWRSG
jgi:effector-binding domain-containing protein